MQCLRVSSPPFWWGLCWSCFTCVWEPQFRCWCFGWSSRCCVTQKWLLRLIPFSLMYYLWYLSRFVREPTMFFGDVLMSGIYGWSQSLGFWIVRWSQRIRWQEHLCFWLSKPPGLQCFWRGEECPNKKISSRMVQHLELSTCDFFLIDCQVCAEMTTMTFKHLGHDLFFIEHCRSVL